VQKKKKGTGNGAKETKKQKGKTRISTESIKAANLKQGTENRERTTREERLRNTERDN